MIRIFMPPINLHGMQRHLHRFLFILICITMLFSAVSCVSPTTTSTEAAIQTNWREFSNLQAISIGPYHIIGLRKDGTVAAWVKPNFMTGVGKGWDIDPDRFDISGWTDIVAVSAGGGTWLPTLLTLGLRKDGTVVETGTAKSIAAAAKWKNIIAVAVGYDNAFGLKSDGTVVTAGKNENHQGDVAAWENITSIAVGWFHTVGLKSDGTVVAVGSNDTGQCDVSSWKDVVAISAGGYHTVGLKKDGTVVATGNNGSFQCDVSDWKDVIAVSAGYIDTIGLIKDGTVRSTKSKPELAKWADLIAIAASMDSVIGLRQDGTLVAADLP